jgi:hypothetical protein
MFGLQLKSTCKLATERWLQPAHPDWDFFYMDSRTFQTAEQIEEVRTIRLSSYLPEDFLQLVM